MSVPTDLAVPKGWEEKIKEIKGGETVYSLGYACFRAECNHREKYLVLCKEIRELQMRPEHVTLCLAAASFSKERISEIKRVCFTSDAIFKEFCERFNGFRFALAKARESGVKISASARLNRFFSVFARFAKGEEVFGPRIFEDAGKAMFLFKAADIKEQSTFEVGKWRVVVSRITKKPAPKKVKNDKASND